MSVTIRPISSTSKRDLTEFIEFNYRLYRHCPYAVPEMYDDLLGVLDARRNAAYEFCQAQLFLAYKDSKAAGRIAAIINTVANETWGTKTVRFGWPDFIDDAEVVDALMNAVIEWGRERGMKEIEGPLGFTDFDREGMLIDGFDQLSTMATHYNYPYYPTHMERMGFEKAVDWVQFKIFAPDEIPDKHRRVCELVRSRYHVRLLKYTSRKRLAAERGQEIFDLFNEAYAPLHGFSHLSDKQIQQYIHQYLSVVDLKLIPMVVDEQDRLIGIGVMMPSLSKALIKGRGARHLWGYLPLIWAMFIKHPKNTDLLLVAIKPEYQGKGINALLFEDLIPTYKKLGYEYAESNLELETNHKVQSMWDYFEHQIHKRNRAWRKEI